MIKYEKCGGEASIAFELRVMISFLAKYEIVILELFRFLFRLQKMTFEVVVVNVNAPARAQDYPNPSRSSPRSIPNKVLKSIQKIIVIKELGTCLICDETSGARKRKEKSVDTPPLLHKRHKRM